jgi:hypothetical protein
LLPLVDDVKRLAYALAGVRGYAVTEDELDRELVRRREMLKERIRWLLQGVWRRSSGRWRRSTRP